MKVCASNGVTPSLKQIMARGGGGVSGQPENPPGYATVFLSYLYSKQPILGLTREWFRESSFSRLECGVHNRLHIYTLFGGIYGLDPR